MSNYLAFDVSIENDDLTLTHVSGVTVKVRDVTHGADLANLVADGNGHVAAGSYAVAVGTLLRFRVENYQGRSGYLEQVTT